MAEALYRRHAEDLGCVADVASAGFLPGGVPVPDEVAGVMADRGIDVRHHRSRTLDARLVRGADLVLTMTRQHLIDLAVEVGEDWTRCFTLVDAVRRAEAMGPPTPGTDPGEWVRRLHGGRPRAGLLRMDAADDVDDPMGSRRAAFERTAALLDDLTGRLVGISCPALSASRT
jgi:protein-tyrosine phosphatase